MTDDSCLSNFAFDARHFTALKTNCSVGQMSMRGVRVINPITPGEYVIRWTNDNGEASVIIVDDDQINVAASIDPHLTFDVGAAQSCAGDFVATAWSIDIGHLNTGRTIASSGDDGVGLICTRLSTNVPDGAVVTVKSSNGPAGLVSTSAPADKIPSASAAITDGTPNYGLCYSTEADSGYDLAAAPVAAPPNPAYGTFSVAACTADITSAAESVAGLSLSPLEVWRVSSVTSNAYAALRVKAAIGGTQPAHNDYADALTFVATSTY